MKELIELALSGFWKFLGFVIILYCVLNFAFLIVNRTIRGFTLRKHGYPPAHCDADGDFKKEED